MRIARLRASVTASFLAFSRAWLFFVEFSELPYPTSYDARWSRVNSGAAAIANQAHIYLMEGAVAKCNTDDARDTDIEAIVRKLVHLSEW